MTPRIRICQYQTILSVSIDFKIDGIGTRASRLGKRQSMFLVRDQTRGIFLPLQNRLNLGG